MKHRLTPDDLFEMKLAIEIAIGMQNSTSRQDDLRHVVSRSGGFEALCECFPNRKEGLVAIQRRMRSHEKQGTIYVK